MGGSLRASDGKYTYDCKGQKVNRPGIAGGSNS